MLTASVRLATIVLAAALALLPSQLQAQKALVYCPVGIDATGCNAIVAALVAGPARFPDGAEAIPLKWRLTDANGAPITDLTAVDIRINSLSCGGSVPTDLIEEYASGTSGLKNQGDGNYQFNWKTPTTYATSCKNIGLDFGSGYVELALASFNFKK